MTTLNRMRLNTFFIKSNLLTVVDYLLISLDKNQSIKIIK